MDGQVQRVARDAAHRFSKGLASEIMLLAGLVVEGDAHPGSDDAAPLAASGRSDATEPAAGASDPCRTVGRNARPRGTELQIGDAALGVTGLRSSCAQIKATRPGLLQHLVIGGPEGRLIRKARIMAVVRSDGMVRASDRIGVQLPPLPHAALDGV